jgi:hypothetical protein
MLYLRMALPWDSTGNPYVSYQNAPKAIATFNTRVGPVF